MNNTIYLLRKYWRSHPAGAFSLMFAGILLVAVLLVSFLQYRTLFNRELHGLYDMSGMYDLQLPAVPEDVVQALTAEQENVVRSEIQVLGKTGNDAVQFTYGYLEDAAGLMHLPLEAGRLPAQPDEVAIDRGALRQLHWAGEPGEHITLGGCTYRVVGIIDEVYGSSRLSSELGFLAQDGDIPPHPVPLIYVGSPAAGAPVYTITLLDGLVQTGQDVERCNDFLHEQLGEDARWCEVQQKHLLADDVTKKDSFRFDTRWMLLLAGIAGLVAMLSVYAVLRSVFEKRRHHIRLLRRIGMTRTQIRGMYCVECCGFILLQSLIGILLGLLAYGVLFRYQTAVLGMPDYSAFGCSALVRSRTANAFVLTAALSAAVTGAAYLLLAVPAKERPPRRGRRAGSLRENLHTLFSQRVITGIQVVSLSLICFGTMLGYLYYTDNGKAYREGLKFDFPETYALANGLDLEEDGIAEYYACQVPSVNAIQAFETGDEQFVLTQNGYALGVTDADLSQYSGITACGVLEQTFLISETALDCPGAIAFSAQEEKDFLMEHSDAAYQEFFAAGQPGAKHLYRMPLRMTNAETLGLLRPWLTQGELETDALNRGGVVLVTARETDAFSAGQQLEIGSAMANERYGIGALVQSTVTIAAVVTLPEDCSRLLRYAVLGEQEICLLTTQSGAGTHGFHNAVYTEIFSPADIDGGSLPQSARMSLTSLRDIRHRARVDAAMEYGSMAFLILLMSLLGFAAYFNGILLKIHARTYQISVLRAMGMPLSRIRRKWLLVNLRLPLIAAAVAGVGIVLVQSAAERAYAQLLQLQSGEVAAQEEVYEASIALIDRYFLENQLWAVPAAKPLLLLTLVMCLVTAGLTLRSLRCIDKNIADSLNAGRERL